MNKTEIKFLERLASDILGERMTRNFCDVTIESSVYQDALNGYKQKFEKIIRLRKRGLITEGEAVIMMADC